MITESELADWVFKQRKCVTKKFVGLRSMENATIESLFQRFCQRPNVHALWAIWVEVEDEHSDEEGEEQKLLKCLTFNRLKDAEERFPTIRSKSIMAVAAQEVSIAMILNADASEEAICRETEPPDADRIMLGGQGTKNNPFILEDKTMDVAGPSTANESDDVMVLFDRPIPKPATKKRIVDSPKLVPKKKGKKTDEKKADTRQQKLTTFFRKL
ncbi:hypothetical protein M3Y94_00676400 [Aphelenchoides besseyi]|nr:hypothetical protein M3Y94_00676400 [Aphelenchoides besseyi]